MIICIREPMNWNWPNFLTWLRILAIPLVLVLFIEGKHLPAGAWDPAAGLLFAVAAITDSLDGYLARRLGQTTPLGTFLDPVADKLIVAVALILIVSRDPRTLMILSAVVIIGREIAVSHYANGWLRSASAPRWLSLPLESTRRSCRWLD